MLQQATRTKTVTVVVPGEARPYRERTRIYRRKRPGSKGQPVGSLAAESYMPRKHELYQDKVAWHARTAMAGAGIITGPVRLRVRAYVAIPKSMPKYQVEQIRQGRLLPCKTPDLTNVVKLAEDALTGIVWADDKQVVRGSDDSGRYYSRRPRLEIEVEPLEWCPLQAAEMDGGEN